MTHLAKVDGRPEGGDCLQTPFTTSAVTAKRAFALPEAEFEQDPDYTEHPSRSANISFVCVIGASAILMIAGGVWLFGGMG